MIFKTRGIVFRFTKYGETSIIASIFTDQFGLRSYIINGIRSSKSKNRIALFQPLTLLSLVVYHRENANIERIREVQCLHPYASLLTNVKKSAMAMFITELLNRSVKEESHAAELFEFIMESLITLDRQEHGFESFHLVFMLKLAQYLGFGIEDVRDLISTQPVDEQTTGILKGLLKCSFDTTPKLSNAERRQALDVILAFFSRHIEDVHRMKSLDVLREVFG